MDWAEKIDHRASDEVDFHEMHHIYPFLVVKERSLKI